MGRWLLEIDELSFSCRRLEILKFFVKTVLRGEEMFTGAVKIECVNVNHQRNRPSYFAYSDIEVAKLIKRHVLLTADQIKWLGYPTRRLGHMVKFGFLYRYRVLTEEGSLPSVYAIGPAARYFLNYPIVGVSNPQKVQSIQAVNQVVIYLLSKAPHAQIDLHLHRPVQGIVTINNPLGVVAPRKGFDRTFLSRNKINQAIVILPDRSQVVAGLPVRYCFDEDLKDPFNIKFYVCRTGTKLEQVELFPSEGKEEKTEEMVAAR